MWVCGVYVGVWACVHAHAGVTDRQTDRQIGKEKKKTGAKSEGERDTGGH